jgi:hypothetical protein
MTLNLGSRPPCLHHSSAPVSFATNAAARHRRCLSGRKPNARRAAHSGVGDLVLGLRQFISNLIKRGDQVFYETR